ncbi:MAG: DNA-J related domain-containing protein [Marinobacterium sp.]
MINPVLPQVLSELRQHPEGVSEYYLMRTLERQHAFDDMRAEGLLALYRKHFIIMNALYDLQDILWQEEGRVLNISPLHIELHKARDDADCVCANPSLSEYYLDWHNFETTTAEDVEMLMRSVTGPRH